MLFKTKRGWEIPESAATPEHVFLNRRSFLAAAGFGAASVAIGGSVQGALAETDPTAELYPAPRNERYQVERPLTDEGIASTYNNFYEFGSHKRISRAAQKLETRPWAITFDGLVEEERTVDFDTIIRAMSVEERVYRHRCVEAWAMTVPWSGFPLKDLVAYAKPLSSAKYVRFETFLDPKVAPGQKQSWYPWPYVEGVTIEEAANELSFMVTGAYGKPLAKQFGAPIRLHQPWKYGFKAVKSIVRMSFTEERPVSFWEEIQSREYGFWANVNPEVPHPRWSQATEELIGEDRRVPTRLYNGYGEFVADLYAGLEGERLFM
ncbi:MAG: protein-methionine-sulfoxide reductase catalytic subunit MsrP [Pseudomonadota bacterium]